MKKLLLSFVSLAFAASMANADVLTFNMTTDATDIDGTFVEEKPAEGTSNGVAAHYQPLVSLKVGDFTITCNKASGSTEPAFYYSMSTAATQKSTLRLYKNNAVTVTAPEGTLITACSFTGKGATTIYTGEATQSFTYTATASIQFETISITTGSAGEVVELPKFGYVKNVTDGKKYLIYSSDKVATALSGNYGYLPVSPAEIKGNKIESDMVNAFTFTSVDGGYTIQDSNDKYLYQSGTYNSFNVSAERTDGDVWTVTPQADGTVKIENVAMSKYIQFTSYGNFGSYSNEQGVMPMLFEEGAEGVEIPSTSVPEYATLAEWLAAKPMAVAKVNAPATAIYQNGRYLFITSGNTPMLVYGDLDTKYANGDVIPAGYAGSYKAYNNLEEMVPDKATFAAGTAGTPVDPEVMQCEDISLDLANSYVQIKGATIAEDNGAFTVTDGTATIAIFNPFTNAANYDVVEVAAGTDLTVTGFISRNKEVVQIVPVKITNAQGIEEVAAPTFSVAEGAVVAGTQVALACATEGATIIYTLDGTDPTVSSTKYTEPIVINEAVTIKAFATKDGMAASAVVSASYTIKPDVDPVGTTATFNWADPATLDPVQEAPDSDNKKGIDVGEVVFSNNTITFTVDDSAVKDPGSQYARLYYAYNFSAVELRAYTGSVIKVCGTPKAMLTKIEFPANTKPKAQMTCSVGTIAYSADGITATWTAPSADGVQSVDFNVNGTTYISATNVTFKNYSSGVEAIATDVNAPVEFYNLQGVRMNGDNLPAGLYIRRQGNTASKVLVK